MTLVAWILLIPFGLFGLRFASVVLFGGSLDKFSAIFMVFCILISALCAGYLWGGLDSYIK